MLFPTHRVVSGLSPELWERLPELLAERWELEEVADVDALERRIVAPARNVRSFGLVRGAGQPPLTRACAARRRRRSTSWRWRRSCSATCSVSTRTPSRRPIASPICARAADAAALVDAAPPHTAVALLVPPPTVADVEAVADADQTMPPKSTFFFPKILDGMVFNQLDPFDP